MSTILTGIKSNSTLHIGNYIGALKPMNEIQQKLTDNDKLYFFVPDLHTLTVPVEHSELYSSTVENVKMYVAAGINPARAGTTLFRQSFVPAHSEFAWLLSCFTHFGEASRMTEFKDRQLKAAGKPVGVGLFSYPILMAADILLYGADFVPVGADQKQHMELARNLAERINTQFGDILTVPKSWKEQLEFTSRIEAPRIKSLQNPSKKMSKSTVDPKGTIDLTDTPDMARKKIMSAQTDSLEHIALDPEKQPGLANLMSIEAALRDVSIDEIARQWTGQPQYGPFKKAVAETVAGFLTDFQTSLSVIDEVEIESYLAAGESQARTVAGKTLISLQKAAGLRR